jgi:hypothetical protein
MRLVNKKGELFSLSVKGYQYPDNLEDYWDSNWLIVKIKCKSEKFSFSKLDPCLTTFEYQILMDWFKKISLNSTVNELIFTENTLLFQLTKDQRDCRCIRVNVQLPYKRMIERGERIYSLDFPLDEIRFNTVTNKLQKELNKYPQRIYRTKHNVAISKNTPGLFENTWTIIKRFFSPNKSHNE